MAKKVSLKSPHVLCRWAVISLFATQLLDLEDSIYGLHGWSLENFADIANRICFLRLLLNNTSPACPRVRAPYLQHPGKR